LTFDDLRSFALGELGWSLERYLKSTLYEFNEAASGYWRRWERETAWMSREIVWELIRGNPYYKKEDKPVRKSDVMKLSIEKEEKRAPDKVTEEDLKIFQQLQFNKDGTI